MDSWSLAFFTGLFGSLHCLGMCGPLAFSISSASHHSLDVFFDKLAYQLGRILAYMILGLVAGLLGRQLWIWGAQQYLSIFSGILILCAGLVRIFKWRRPHSRLVPLNLVNRFMSWALKNNRSHLYIGLLNGFLPCGFVYIALAGAVNAGSVQEGMGYMAFFGLGTLPLMLIATISINFFSPSFRRKANRLLPVFMLCLGVWFLFRGMNIGVDYLSPRLKNQVECGPHG